MTKQAVFASSGWSEPEDVVNNPLWHRLHDIGDDGMIISDHQINAWNLARTALDIEFTEEELAALGNPTINRILARVLPAVIGYTTQDLVHTIEEIQLAPFQSPSTRAVIAKHIDILAKQRLASQAVVREVSE